jgi:hypothetical protein
MKVAAMTKTMTSAYPISRVGALSTSCFSFLSAVRPKVQQSRTAKKHGVLQHLHGFTPQPASPCVMLVSSDMGGGSYDILS